MTWDLNYAEYHRRHSESPAKLRLSLVKSFDEFLLFDKT